jgi:acetylornithine deacetylase
VSPAGEPILSHLEGRGAEIASALQELVGIPTVNPYSGDPQPSGEAAGQEWAAERMRELGGEVRRVPVPPDVYARAGLLGPRDRDWTGRENLVGRFAFGSGRTKIVLNAHMDTIGVSDYQGEPFSGRLDGDVVHGRGASDCKCGVVAGLFAIRALRESGAAPDCEILFESVIDEECNGAGAGTVACCLAGVRGDWCLVLDGYAGMIYHSCQGICTADLAVSGRAGHGSLGGVSAIEKLLLVKRAVDRLAAERAESHPEHLVNVGVLRAGTAPWVVPASGELSANINYAYDEAAAAERAGKGFGGALVRERLEELLAEACAADGWLREQPPGLVWVKDVPPYVMTDGAGQERCDRLLDVAREAHRRAWGAEAEVRGLPAWCDASHLGRVGKMPTLGMGAGQGGTAHTATEHNRVSNVVRTAATVAMAVERLAAATS